MEVETVVRTPRLEMRQLQEHDSVALAQIADDKVISENTAAVPYPYELKHARSFIADSQKHRQLKQRYSNGIFRLADQQLIGVIALGLRNAGYSAQISYWLGAEYRRQGYMAEAVKGIMKYGFNDLGLARIETACFASNTASFKVLEACGFVYEGCQRRAFKKGDVVHDLFFLGALSDEFDNGTVSRHASR
jgi:RimJ/RimL family protein N-acetyltransferase